MVKINVRYGFHLIVWYDIRDCFFPRNPGSISCINLVGENGTVGRRQKLIDDIRSEGLDYLSLSE